MGLQHSVEHAKRSSEGLENRILKIVNGEFDLDALKLQHEIYSVTEEIEDETRGLKSVATEFVVNEFFTTASSLYNFLSVINDTFESALEVYCRMRNLDKSSVFFVWKGGNILLLVERQFLEELPEAANRAIREFYAPFFKRSDCDFSIYIHPNVDDYDAIYHEITLLAYQVQDYLRSQFRNEAWTYFDFTRYNDGYRKKVLQKWLSKFNSDGNQYVNFEPHQSGPDLTMRFVEDDYPNPIRQAARAEIKNVGSIMKITHNHLDFPNPNGLRARFNLTRTKVFFRLTSRDGQQTLVGGELIDCSIPHRLDNNMDHFFEDLNANLASYTLRVQGGENLEFVSLSISYLISDLIVILFKFNAYPWDDEKYGKRMNRLMYLYFVDIFIRLKNAHLRLKVLQDFKSMLQNFDIDTFRERHDHRGLQLNEFLDHLQTLLKASPNVVELEKLRLLLLENVDFLIGTIENLHAFCSTDGSATPDEIYEGKLSSLV